MALLSSVREALVSVRDRRDAWLHGSRSSDARDRLRRLEPTTLLFVCLGNVCRSPYAERVARGMAGPGMRVDSAGFIGPGRAPPSQALRVAAERGVHHADHRSKVLTPDLLRTADVVFIFDRFNQRRLRSTPGGVGERTIWLGDLDPVWSGKRAIIDPWGGNDDDFRAVFDRIDRCLGATFDVIDGGGRRRATGDSPEERA